MKSKLFAVSTFTLVGLYALLSIIIIGIGVFTTVPIITSIIISIVILIIQFLLAPWITDITMRIFYKADYKAQIPDYLDKFVEEISQKYKMKKPKLALINDGSPNAFTYGRTKNDARIVVTQGIFDLLTEEEVKTVVAHELGHVVHYDMLVMTAAQLIPLLFYLVYQMFLDSSDNSSNNDNDNSAIIGLVAYVLYIISEFIILWLSRTREYYADEFSIQETKNPNSLAQALVKIGFGLNVGKTTNKHSTKNIGALGIFDSKASKSLIVTTNNNIDDTQAIKNSMKWEMWNPWAFFYELQSTHPLISKRLIAISNYSKQYEQEPYIEFDENKPESYVDDFAIELLIGSMPLIFGIITLVLFVVYISNTKQIYLTLTAVFGIIMTITLFIKFKISHKTGYKDNTVRGLLGEVKVSGITSIPCQIEGTIIGRGDPGYMFSEDMVIKDETGIIFLDYNQPLWIMNKIFALFSSEEMKNKKIKVRGWYRRSPVPYIEIYEYEVDNKTKKIFTYGLTRGFYVVLLIFFILLTLISIF